MSARQAPVFGTITDEQLERIAADEARVADARRRANVIILQPEARHAEGAVNCARCAHICNHNAERKGGWCMQCRRMVSTWHPVYCQIYKEAA